MFCRPLSNDSKTMLGTHWKGYACPDDSLACVPSILQAITTGNVAGTTTWAQGCDVTDGTNQTISQASAISPFLMRIPPSSPMDHFMVPNHPSQLVSLICSEYKLDMALESIPYQFFTIDVFNLYRLLKLPKGRTQWCWCWASRVCRNTRQWTGQASISLKSSTSSAPPSYHWASLGLLHQYFDSPNGLLEKFVLFIA